MGREICRVGGKETALSDIVYKKEPDEETNNVVGSEDGELSQEQGDTGSSHHTTLEEVNFSDWSGGGVKVAVVGSPSSSSEITLDLTSAGRNSKLVGTTVAVLNSMGENGEELGLGTVTEVITRNKWHEDTNFRGARNEEGILSGFSGDSGDQREAKIKIQASWNRENVNDVWKSAGTQLGMSPATGTGVCLITQKIIDDITETYEDLHYNGSLGGSEGLPLPLDIPDNATSQGALHYGVFGRSGSGKALHIDTPIPTVGGWKKMGDLVVGDKIFSDEGTICDVVEVHPVQEDKKCYKVSFSDGETIIADAEHLWEITWVKEEGGKYEKGVFTTAEIVTRLAEIETVSMPHFFVSTPKSLQPFTTITENSETGDEDRVEKARKDGADSYRTVKELITSEDEVYDFYDEYVRGSEKVRTAFLEGVLTKQGFLNEHDGEGLKGYYRSDNFLHTKLISTLLTVSGFTPRLHIEPVDIVHPEHYNVVQRKTITTQEKLPPHLRVFYFLDWPETSFEKTYRSITKIEETESVPVRCITVNSPSRLYLAGRTFIPTHNTASACYTLAGQLRHDGLGMVIVDPQGQWAAEHNLPFSFQGFAEELGRKVTVARVSEDLRLNEEANLFRSLLDRTKFYNKLRIKHPQTKDVAGDEIVSILENIEDWSKIDSTALLRKILDNLCSETVSGRIYSGDATKERFQSTIQGILASQKEFRVLYSQFQPVLNLFQEYNSHGGKRQSLWVALKNVFAKEHGVPAPVLIVDMSSRPPEVNGEDVTPEIESSYTILDNDSMKAAILRNLFANLKRASEEKFRNGENLNTMIVLDEAWRYAAPTNKISSDEDSISELSKDLAGYARDTRKFGISWFYISQSPRSVNPEIWDQIHIFMFGSGLNGLDLDKATESYEDRNAALRLYKRFGNPAVTGVWPFLLQGPVSPLMSANAPLVLNMYTTFQQFREDNEKWITEHRNILGKPVLSGDPIPPQGKVLKKGHVERKLKTVNETLDVMKKDATHSEHMKDVGLKDPEGFTDPLALI